MGQEKNETEKKTGLIVVAPKGDMTVEKIGSFRQELLEAFQEKKTVILDASDVTRCDLSFIQVILSARKYAQNYGRSFRFRGALCESLVKTFLASGICRTAPLSGEDLEAFQVLGGESKP